MGKRWKTENHKIIQTVPALGRYEERQQKKRKIIKFAEKKEKYVFLFWQKSVERW